MTDFKVNKIKIDGQQNITLQDIKDSTITIDTGNLEELKQMMAEIQMFYTATTQNTVNVFVLSTTVGRVKTIASLHANAQPEKWYGESPKDWKPFSERKTIADHVVDFYSVSGFKIDVYFIDDWQIEDFEVMALLKDDISPFSILIVDPLALHFEKNRMFAEIFDKSEIGGCLIIRNRHLPKSTISYADTLIAESFKHLKTCFYKRFSREYMNIEPEVDTAEKLYRRLSNIAIKHLNIRPLSKVNWQHKYLQDKKLLSMSKLNTAF